VQRLSPYPSVGFWRERERAVRRGVVIAIDAVHGTVVASVVRYCSGDLGATRRNATDVTGVTPVALPHAVMGDGMVI
jgi:hypothetical protein